MSDLLIGWDVGGAHLKRAGLGPDGSLVSIHLAPCALWQGLDRRRSALASMAPGPGRSVTVGIDNIPTARELPALDFPGNNLFCSVIHRPCTPSVAVWFRLLCSLPVTLYL